MALVVHVRSLHRSWRLEGEREAKFEQALGAPSKFAVNELKASPDDAKWAAIVYDNHGVVAAVARDTLEELVPRLGEFPEIEEALTQLRDDASA